jgi:hypothetical protein
MAELVRDHRRQLGAIQQAHQRQTDDQIVAVAEQTEQPRHARRTGVEIAVDHHRLQRRCAGSEPQTLDLGFQRGRFAGRQPIS